MENNLRTYAQAGVTIKRFTYTRDGRLVACKPTNTEKFILVEDFFGDRSIVWVACVENNKEQWRHNVSDMVRITNDTPVDN